MSPYPRDHGDDPDDPEEMGDFTTEESGDFEDEEEAETL